MSSSRPEHPPLFHENVAAGFPSPAEGDRSGALDLNELCVKRPEATYFVRARGESMVGAGIDDGDILVVDRSLPARNADIIIAAVAGEFTVKRLEKSAGGVRLMPENPAYKPIVITPELEAEFFGVVTYIIKQARRASSAPSSQTS